MIGHGKVNETYVAEKWQMTNSFTLYKTSINEVILKQNVF